MAVVRWVNLIAGALLIVAALGFLVFLPANIADYAREPEDVRLGIYWIVGLVLLATLCFANARHSAGARWLALANLVVVIGLALLLFVGRDDPALVALLVLCAFGPASVLIVSSKRAPVERS
jgi:hypothetical protein